jgi:hypothetical protein
MKKSELKQLILECLNEENTGAQKQYTPSDIEKDLETIISIHTKYKQPHVVIEYEESLGDNIINGLESIIEDLNSFLDDPEIDY